MAIKRILENKINVLDYPQHRWFTPIRKTKSVFHPRPQGSPRGGLLIPSVWPQIVAFFFSRLNHRKEKNKFYAREASIQWGPSGSLMSRIERKYCSISTSYLVGLSDIFILLHIWQNCVCFGVLRTLCDAYHKDLNLISVQSWTYLIGMGRPAAQLDALSGGGASIFQWRLHWGAHTESFPLSLW